MLWEKSAYNVSQKIYDGVLRLMVFDQPQRARVSEKGLEEKITPSGEYIEKEEYQFTIDDIELRKMRSEKNSRSRALNMVYDLGMSNHWEWFITLTFDQRAVDRYNYDECQKKASKWLDNLRQRYAPDLKYLLVPDLHEDGAFHFHGLMADCGELEFKKTPFKSKKGRKVLYAIGGEYDVEKMQTELKGGYRFGISSASKITARNVQKTVGYLTKYITKNIAQVTVGRQKYLRSQNLNKPDRDRYYLYPDQIEKIIRKYRQKKKIAYEKTIYVDSGNYQNIIHLYEISIADMFGTVKAGDMEKVNDVKNRVDRINRKKEEERMNAG